MSTLLLNTLTGKTSAGSIVVTGEGGSTTTNMQQGLAKARVNFSGESTAATTNTFNIGSLTDQGTGQYQFAITNDMANVNSVFTCAVGNRDEDNAGYGNNSQIGTDTAGTFHYESMNISTNGNEDATSGQALVHGDLA